MAITSNVSNFLTQVKQGVRPNMFQVDITFPGTVEADQTLVSYVNLLHFLHQTLVLLKFHSEEEQLRLLETEHLITGQRHSSMIKR